MTRLTRALSNGQPITLWRHSSVTSEEFNVPERPMKGEMDPFFFLTKEKNFIPHEYPCRTDFAELYRGRMPLERDTAQPEITWLGFGSPRLDLSGFWFRATRIAARAETLLTTETGGIAKLKLSTCGGAILRVNGELVLWMADYRRNFETSSEVEVTLTAGENHLELFFDDLAERDTRFYIQLDYVDGPAAHQAIAVDCSAAAAKALETALTSMHFERASYDGTDLRLMLPAALGVDATATIKVEGDFMSHDPFAPIERHLSAQCTSIEVGNANDLPADFRHFLVHLTVGCFTASRTFGAEVSHANLQGQAPQSLSARIEEALKAIAVGGEADTVCALARLATGDGGTETRNMIAAALLRIDGCWDCADFALVPLIWCRKQYAHLLGAEFSARIDQTILGYRYWMDEPGNDVQWYFSENHALLFHTAAHLGGALLPDQNFVRSGRTGKEQSLIGQQRLHAWFDHFETCEMAEFNSAPYFPIDLKGMTAIYALSPDPALRERAGRAILRLLELVANSAHQGILTAAQGRSYEHTLRGTMTLELSAMARLLWGRGSYGTRFHTTPQLALCLRDHALIAPDLTERACFEGENSQEWYFAQGEGNFAKLYHHKTKDHAMGSTVAYRWGDWGYQETLIHARIGENAQAQVWINHPGEVIHSGYGRPSYWGGSASVPRVQQYRDLAIVVLDGVAPQPDFTHAWFPIADFDISLIYGDTAFASQDQAHLMLKGSGAFELVKEGPTANHELRLAGRNNHWIVRLGSQSQHGSHAAFAEAMKSIQLSRAADTIEINDPDYGLVTFMADGTIYAEGRTIDPSTMTVQGTRSILPRASRAGA
jgi:hypothetical protein